MKTPRTDLATFTVAMCDIGRKAVHTHTAIELEKELILASIELEALHLEVNRLRQGIAAVMQELHPQ